MIVQHTISLDERQHAVVTALEIPHTHGDHYYDATQITVQIDIPDDVILSDAIRIDKGGNLAGSPGYPRLQKYDDGTPKFEGWIDRSTGNVREGPIRLNIRNFDLKERVEELVKGRLSGGSAVTRIVYADDVAPCVAADQAEIDAAQPLVPGEESRQKAEYEKYLVEKRIEDEQDAADRAEKQKKRDAADAISAAYKARVAVWVAEKGSAALKLGHEKGYPCQKRYEQEWGSVELGPDYNLDFGGETVSMKGRSCPSEDALNEQVRIEALSLPDVQEVRVVWLPKGLDQLDEDYTDGYNEPNPREAVMIVAHGTPDDDPSRYFKLF
jgi:hypothetical protein